METKWQPPPQWPTKIYQAYEDFALETGISKRRLAQVLGIDSGEFNKCHLERLDKHKYLYNLHGRLLEHSTITSVAAELGLDRKGYHALKRLKAHIFSINSGYSMDADRLVLSTQDVLDSGMVGVELRDQGYWEDR